jgi:hypothetical protein
MLALSKFFCLFVFFLTACGGGDSSGTPGTTSTPKNDPWALQTPAYSGLRSPYSISSENVSETVYSTLESLDLLHSLAFGDDLSYFYFFSENRLDILNTEPVCETGSVEENIMEAQSRLELTYANCRIDGFVIDGILRAQASGSSDISVLPDLTLTELATGESLQMLGYYRVSGVGRTDRTAVFNLVLQSSDEGQIWFDDLNLQTSHFGNDFGINYEGDIYISDVGKLSISTVDLGPHTSNRDVEFASTTLQLEGTETLTFDVELQNKVVINFQSDFTSVEIPLGQSATVVFSNTNQAPIAQTELDLYTVARNTPLEISAQPSRDPNFDPLMAYWTVTSQPEGASVQMSQGVTLSILADLPGNYIIRLQVTDPSGAQSDKEVSIKVNKNAPQGQVVLNQVNVIGEPVLAQLQLSNDEFDAPYSYRLKYGPANMQVDNSGNISWDGVMPDYGKDMQVNFAIVSKNSDATSTFEHSLELKSNGQPVVTKRDNSITFAPWQQSENGNILNLSRRITSLTVDGSEITETPIQIIGEHGNTVVTYQATSDVNNDGVDDFWYQLWNSDAGTYEVYWQDGANRQSNMFYDAGNRELQILTLDYNLNGRRELIYGNLVFDTQSGEKLVEADESIAGNIYCDANQDGKLDSISQNSPITTWTGTAYDFTNEQNLPEIERGASFIKFGSASECGYIVEDELDLVFKTYGREFQRVLLTLPNSLQRYSILSADIDGDGVKEVIIAYSDFFGGPGPNDLYVIEDPTAEQLVISQLNVDLRESSSVLDMNNDGTDEFVTFNITSGQPSNIWAQNIIDGNIEDTLRSEDFIPSLFELVEWQDNGELVTLSKEGIVQFSADNVKTTTALPNAADVRVKNNVIEIFGEEQQTDNVARFNINGDILWSTDVNEDDPFGIDRVDAQSSELVLVESYQYYSLLHPESGAILERFMKKISASNLTEAFHTGLDGRQRFLSEVGRVLYEIGDNFDVTALTSPAIEKALEDSHKYSFTQLDSDPQPEIVLYSTSSQTYRIFDTVTLEEELPGEFHNGKAESSTNLNTRIIAHCFEWDTECKNYIQYHDHSGLSYNVVDKLTGRIIWSSPTLGLGVEKIAFARSNNEIKTFMSYQAYTIE